MVQASLFVIYSFYINKDPGTKLVHVKYVGIVVLVKGLGQLMDQLSIMLCKTLKAVDKLHIEL